MTPPLKHDKLVKERARPEIAMRGLGMRGGWLGHHCWKTPINAYRSHQNYVSLCENKDLLLCRTERDDVRHRFSVLSLTVYSHIRVP
jgi:hypothetical protein